MSRMRARSAMSRALGGLGAVDDGTSAPRSRSASAAANPLTPEPGDEHAQPGPVGVAVVSP